MLAPALRLPAEVWVEVVSVLVRLDALGACTSLARLARACRQTHALVEAYGWDVFLQSYPVTGPRSPSSTVPSSPPKRPGARTHPHSPAHTRTCLARDLAAESHRCRRAWGRMDVCVTRAALAPSYGVRGHAYTQRVNDPLLLLTSEHVLVLVHSQVHVRPTHTGDAPGRARTGTRARAHPHPLGPLSFDLIPSSSRSKATGATQSLTAACVLDDVSAITRILISRIDGSLEEYELPVHAMAQLPKKKKRGPQPVQAASTLVSPPVPTPATTAAAAAAGRPSIRRMLRQPAQALSYANGLLACLSRAGRLALWSRRGARGAPSAWVKLWEVDLRMQAWTCLLDAGHRWLVIGAKGAESLLLYPLGGGGADTALQAPVVLSTLHCPATPGVAYHARVGEGRLSSVFAVAQSGDLLVAGFYDGVVRIYDLKLVPWDDMRSTSLTLADKWPLPAYLVADATTGSSTPTASTSTGASTDFSTGQPPSDGGGGLDGDVDIHSDSDDARSVPALTCSMYFRDRFDDSAVYSVALGPDHVLAGMSTSGAVKMYPLACPAAPASLAQLSEISPASLVARTRMRELDHQPATLSTALPPGSAVGRTVYAGYPSRSPVFALVAQWDRIMGVTDTLLFDIGIAPPPRPRPGPGPGPGPARDMGRNAGAELGAGKAPRRARHGTHTSTPQQAPSKALPPRPRSPDYVAQRAHGDGGGGGDEDDLSVLPYLALESVAITYA